MKINKAKEEIQLEAFEALKKNNFRGFVHIPTGVGKGLLLMKVIDYLKPKRGIYAVDSELNRDVTFKNDLIKWGYEKYIPDLEYHCYQTTYKFKNEHYTLGLCDEADFSLSKKYSRFYNNNTFDHLVLCSGSLEPAKQKMLEKLDIPVVYSITIEEAENRGAINKARHFFVNYKLNSEENKKYLRYNEQFAYYLQAEKVNNFFLDRLKIQRKQFLSRLTSSFRVAEALLNEIKKSDENARVVIFTGLSEQADKFDHPFHSNTDDSNLQKFNDGEIDDIQVVEKITRGANIFGINHVVYESPSSSLTKLQQKSGRGRRLDVEEYLNCYYLIPYYVTRKGELKPTIVQNWVLKNSEKLNIKNIKNYKFNKS